jgi:PhoH-like ATPase
MAQKATTYVLDTNVLIHDPTALFRFMEHHLYVPMVVLEELDAIKKGSSEVARNARQASRYLDEIIGQADVSAIAGGLPLQTFFNGGELQRPLGRLYLQTRPLRVDSALLIAGSTPDNSILETVLALKTQGSESEIVLVSKDINLRIKARVLGLNTEDYSSDKVLDDIELLYAGLMELPADFWSQCRDEVKCWKEENTTYYSVPEAGLHDSALNECLFIDDENLELIVHGRSEGVIVMRQARDYRVSRNAVWGISARNREQNFALNLLMDPDIEFVSLVGVAGTGKTLLALAAGLSQCMEQKRYREIVVTRVTIPVGEDIGFLPGTEEEKMTPWMGALMDNLEVLSETDEGGEWGRAASADLIQHRIKIRSLNFMRGRTFLNRFVIIDEAQNLTPKQMKTLITRAGPGSKFVCLGNIAQIDTPYLSETTSGLTFVVDRFKNWGHSGHMILTRGERSRLADFATQNL